MTIEQKSPTEEPITEVSFERRSILRRVGFGALAALSGSALLGQASAQPTPPKPGPRPKPAVNIDSIRATRISALQHTEFQALKLTQRAPSSTSITKLGLTSDGIAKLTAPAKQLTKEDLEALGRGDFSNAKVRDLTVEDISSIRVAFGTAYQPGAGRGPGVADIDVSCCCCTPCCCAAAVTVPLKLAA